MFKTEPETGCGTPKRGATFAFPIYHINYIIIFKKGWFIWVFYVRLNMEDIH